MALSAGACLKPHFVVQLLLIELVLLAQSRNWKSLFAPEALGFAGLILVYIGHWLVVPTAMRQEFFGPYLQMMVQGYAVYNERFVVVIQTAWRETALAGIGLVGGAVGLKRDRRPSMQLLLSALMMGIIASYAAYLIQHKGWRYHRIPFVFFTLLTLAVIYGQIIRHFAANAGRRRLATALAAMSVLSAGVCTAAFLVQTANLAASEPPAPDLEQLVLKATEPHDPVLFISTWVAPAYPMLLNVDRRPGSRYPFLFPVAFFYADVRADTPADEIDYEMHSQATPAEQKYLDGLRHDLEKRRPPLVFVRDSEDCQACPLHFNMYVYMQRVGFLRLLAELGYREVELKNQWRAFVAPWATHMPSDSPSR